MYETLTFTGGVHKSEEMKELIEDLGGFILQSNILQMELVINMAIPLDDVQIVQDKAKELLGEVVVALLWMIFIPISKALAFHAVYSGALF